MGRIICIDYGRKRCGVAVTDVLQISANGLPTVRTCDLEQFLVDYCAAEPVDEIVVGLPTQLNGDPSESERYIAPFIKRLTARFPDIQLKRFDERFTSTIAHREMIAAGVKKKDRQRKELADEMAAVIILTGYLDSRRLK
ncbi:MAG: Holliday junction resolvase RuvX [Bacteroides sp.]|nr:Holliday junction resolvase RuvX [Bacteroides sp.]